MSIISELQTLGVDTDEALTRFMNNEGLYIRMLKKYPAAVEGSKAAEKFAQKDHDGAIAETHTLKGVTGNLSLTPLYKAYTEMVALLRAGKDDEAAELYQKTLPVEQAIIDCINNN